jgi:hypothetical protein
MPAPWRGESAGDSGRKNREKDVEAASAAMLVTLKASPLKPLLQEIGS